MTKVLVVSTEIITYNTELKMPDQFTEDDLRDQIQYMLENDDFDFTNGETTDFIRVDDWEVIG